MNNQAVINSSLFFILPEPGADQLGSDRLLPAVAHYPAFNIKYAIDISHGSIYDVDPILNAHSVSL